MSQISFSRRFCSASVVALSIALGAPAAAQDIANSAAADTVEGDTVVITGTRIRGSAPVGAPVVAMGQEELRATGAANMTEALRQLPQVTNLGADDSRFNANQGANGNLTAGSAINLRGLGADATLSLLNGRRLPISPTLGTTAGTGAFDVSLIPTAAVSRIEVMADGGSALYGADAVGGVVNTMLRDPFTGGELGVSQRFADGMDGTTVDGALGYNWATGGIMIAGQWQRRSNLLASDRPEQFTDDLRAFGGADVRSYNGAPGNIVVNGVRYAIPAGQDGTSLVASDLIVGNPNRQSIYEGYDALPEQERHSFAATLRQDLTDTTRFKANVLYAVRESERSTGPGGLLQNLTVPNSNPFFVHPTNPSAASVSVAYNLQADFGNQVRNATERMFFATGGFESELGGDWSAEVFASYGHNRQHTIRNEVNSRALVAALADSNASTAFNPFGMGGNNNPTTLGRIAATNEVSWAYELRQFGMSSNGSLFALPGGNVKLAVGAEYFEAELGTFERRNTGTANNTIFALTDVSGVRKVRSVYGELLVPIFGPDNATGGAERLSLSIAGRFDDYSDVGSTTNPKIGFTWTPTYGLNVRGSFGTSFKAPAGPGADKGLVISLQDFVDPTAVGGTTRSLWVRSGVEGLRPETATIWSLGVDATPAAIPGLTASLNYFNVNYEDRIAAPGNDLSPLTKSELADFIIRNPSADLVNFYLNMPSYTGAPQDPATILAFVDGRPRNIGRVKTDGLEFSLGYRFATGESEWTVGVTGQHVLSYRQSLLPDQPLVDYANVINYPLAWSGRANLGWSNGGLSVNAFVTHSGGYENSSVQPFQDVSSYTIADLSVRYKLGDRLGFLKDVVLSADVNNAFDRMPPVVLNGSMAFDPQVASVIGRQFTVGLRTVF